MTAISSGGRFKNIGSTPYVYIQPTPLAVWIVDHNLGHYPDVRVFSQQNHLVSCDVDHPTPNRTLLSFNVPFAGSANFI